MNVSLRALVLVVNLIYTLLFGCLISSNDFVLYNVYLGNTYSFAQKQAGTL